MLSAKEKNKAEKGDRKSEKGVELWAVRKGLTEKWRLD